MIYTVTFNPSLDYIVTVDDFRLGMTNRTTSELMLPGGKGINVSIVLSNLGIENTAFYFAAGFVGDEITRRVTESGIRAEAIPVGDGCGPGITDRHVEELLGKLDGLKEGDTLVLAGSIPSSMPSTIYSDIMQRLQGKGIRIVVDATRELLLNVLQFHPFLVKPNNHELGEIFDVELRTRVSVVPYAKKLQEQGAQNVIVSMAGEGAVLVAADGTVSMHEAPKGTLVNGVGAGDSMVAGFLAGWAEKADYEHAFRMGLAAGSASAFSEYLATKEEVRSVYDSIR